jgi:hypothetical protein
VNKRPTEPEPMTRRTYLQYRALMAGAAWPLAMEAVASVAIEHPEWDMDDEAHTFSEWEQRP